MKRILSILILTLILSACQPKLSPEELEAKWRVPMVLSAINAGTCTTTIDTANQVQAGELEGFESFGAVLGMGMMLRLVDEGLADFTPTPDQEDLTEQMSTDMNELRGVIGPWMDQETNSADVLTELELLCPELQETFEEVVEAAGDDGMTREAQEAIMDAAAEAFSNFGEPAE